MFSISGITKKYGKLEALKEVNLNINSGVTAIIGCNGAGKTTLFNILTGRITPEQGIVEFNGSIPTKIRHKIGFLMEEPPFYPYLKGKEQIYYYNFLRDNPVGQEQINNLINKWSFPSNKRVAEYSLGMKKRLGLACACIGYPKILILDEPFNGLDIEGQQILEGLLNIYRKKNQVLIFSSHQIEKIVFLADQVVVLQEGKVVLCDSVRELEQCATEILLYLPLNTSRDLLNIDNVTELDERGPWLSVTVKKKSSSELLESLARHGVFPHSTQVVIPALKDLLHKSFQGEENDAKCN